MNKVFTVVVIAALLAILPQPSAAQFGVAVGGRVGFNIANTSYSPDLRPAFSKSSRLGFGIGAVVEFRFMPFIALSLEPTYIQGGDKIDGPFYADANTGQPVQATVTDKVSELQFPILFKAKLPVGPVKPYVLVGPSIGIVLSASETDELKGGYKFQDGSTSVDIDNKDKTSSTDFALMFGVGSEFNVVPMLSLTFDIRYALGLTNLLSNQPAQQQQVTIKSNGIMFFVGALVRV